MPSDIKGATAMQRSPADATTPLVEPPSVKLIVRLFLIPFFIVAVAVGIMFLISLLAGRTPTVDEAIAGLKSSGGGGRTADLLVGPGAKQRYLYAKTLTDHMKLGLSESERVKLTGDLINILDQHTKSDEGEVQHFLLLALGRAWQVDPAHPDSATPEATAARQKAAEALLRYAQANDVNTRKAAVLAMVYFKAREEVASFVPALTEKVRNEREDLDVRLAAATVLGPLSTPQNKDVIDALHDAMRDSDPHDVELVWAAALSLAQLDQRDVADTILKLLSREELASVQVYDRESDPKNPSFRNLNEQEQERILINTMIGVDHYDVPAVQEQLRKLATSDPSSRVRAALRAKSPIDATGAAK
jgi:hypothetical protein